MTAVARLFSNSRSPLAVSDVIVLDDKETNVVLPTPLNAVRLTVSLVTKPEPLIEPLADVIAT